MFKVNGEWGDWQDTQETAGVYAITIANAADEWKAKILTLDIQADNPTNPCSQGINTDFDWEVWDWR